MSVAMPPVAGGNSKGKVAVFIHGAGEWPDGYWNDIIDQAPFKGLTFGTIGVRYSQIFETDQVSAAGSSADAKQFQSDFINLLAWERIVSQVTAGGIGSLGNLPSMLLPGGIPMLSLDPQKIILGALSRALFGIDFVQLTDQISATPFFNDNPLTIMVEQVSRYLYDAQTANLVRAQLIAGLEQAQAYDEIVLVSHSLGTVVAFDVLNLRNDFIPKISHWLTLGCPIHKVMHLRPEPLPSPLPHAQIPNWFNIYDTADIVASPLGPAIDLHGCFVHDIFVKVANSMPAAHDYFHNLPSLEVIADTLR